VPTPVVAHDLVFITNAHGRMAPILAISTAAEGELTIDAEGSDHTVWSQRRGGNYMQTPLVYGDELYCCKDAGVLSCIEARTGERLYRERLGSGHTGFSASGVAADGKLYFTSEEGEVHVIRAGRAFEVLAVNEMGETCMATPAVSTGTLYFRTRRHLVAVADSE
jgi:outer membrane protein assembly factor BamB